MSFDTIEVNMTIEVYNDETESVVTSFRHAATNEELDFGIKDMLLCDVEGFRANRVTFPKEPGEYELTADYHTEEEVIEGIFRSVKTKEFEKEIAERDFYRNKENEMELTVFVKENEVSTDKIFVAPVSKFESASDFVHYCFSNARLGDEYEPLSEEEAEENVETGYCRYFDDNYPHYALEDEYPPHKLEGESGFVFAEKEQMGAFKVYMLQKSVLQQKMRTFEFKLKDGTVIGVEARTISEANETLMVYMLDNGYVKSLGESKK